MIELEEIMDESESENTLEETISYFYEKVINWLDLAKRQNAEYAFLEIDRTPKDYWYMALIKHGMGNIVKDNVIECPNKIYGSLDITYCAINLQENSYQKVKNIIYKIAELLENNGKAAKVNIGSRSMKMRIIYDA